MFLEAEALSPLPSTTRGSHGVFCPHTPPGKPFKMMETSPSQNLEAFG